MFAARGLERASIDEIAEDAGFTKGAFYANFTSKEELFLAMLDERFAERLAEIDRVARDRRPTRRSRRARPAPTSTRYLRADPEWQRLFFEFAAYAARNERLPRRAGQALPRAAGAHGRRCWRAALRAARHRAAGARPTRSR